VIPSEVHNVVDGSTGASMIIAGAGSKVLDHVAATVEFRGHEIAAETVANRKMSNLRER
jgi:hypothetical protein